MYQSVRDISTYTATCEKVVRKKVKAMKASGLYPATCFLYSPQRIDLDAYLHYAANELLIAHGMKVPAWRREA